ncbi:MAG: hypothetical protein IJB41_07075, partial [Clostridia bacterium]|nr:hypothetical protein [Clostridia bacterium]
TCRLHVYPHKQVSLGRVREGPFFLKRKAPPVPSPKKPVYGDIHAIDRFGSIHCQRAQFALLKKRKALSYHPRKKPVLEIDTSFAIFGGSNCHRPLAGGGSKCHRALAGGGSNCPSVLLPRISLRILLFPLGKPPSVMHNTAKNAIPPARLNFRSKYKKTYGSGEKGRFRACTPEHSVL